MESTCWFSAAASAKNDAQVRADVCAGLDWIGVRLDESRNQSLSNSISDVASRRGARCAVRGARCGFLPQMKMRRSLGTHGHWSHRICPDRTRLRPMKRSSTCCAAGGKPTQPSIVGGRCATVCVDAQTAHQSDAHPVSSSTLYHGLQTTVSKRKCLEIRSTALPVHSAATALRFRRRAVI